MERKYLTLLLAILYNISYSQTIPSRVDSLEKVVGRQPLNHAKADNLVILSEYYFQLGYYEKAAHTIDEALSLSLNLHYDFGRFNALCNKGRIVTALGEKDNGKVYFDSARQLISRLLNGPGHTAKVDYLVGSHYVSRMQIDSGLSYLTRAESAIIKTLRKLEDTILLCNILAQKARGYTKQGTVDSAMKYSLKALDVAEKANDPLTIHHVYTKHARVLSSTKLYAQSANYYHDAMAIAREYGLWYDYARYAQELSAVHGMTGALQASYKYLSEAIAILRKHETKDPDSKDEYSRALVDYASLLTKMDSLDKAEEAIKEAFGMQNFSKFTFLNFLVITKFCAILHAKKDYEEEWKYLQLGDTLAAASQMPQCVWEINDQKVKYYKATGNYAAAMDMLEQNTSLLDSIQSTELQQTIADLNTRYETEKKNKEIALLNATKQVADAKLSRRNAYLILLSSLVILLIIAGISVYRRIQYGRKTEMEMARLEQINKVESVRNRISRDIHDDIGASLSKISMLAQQAKMQMQQGNVQDTQSTFEKITSATKEVISGLGTMVWAINPQHDTLKSMIGFMKNYISGFFESSGVRCITDFPEDGENLTIHPELKRNLFLVLKEALNNIVKHSGATEVMIRFITHNGGYYFEISDNGRGLQKGRSFSAGLTSMKKRMEEIRGLFNLKGGEGTGTTIELEGMLY